MKTHSFIAITAGLLFATGLNAAEPQAIKPAFPGQTQAAAPKTPSPAVTVTQLVRGLGVAWSFAFLPDGGVLITENNGTIRILRPDGVLSAPLTGVPGVKSVAAQGLHDVLLDPDFARNRILYLTYLAPPPGEKPGVWPNAHWYENVWKLSVAERRRTDLGHEVLARARLNADNSGLTDVQVLVEGAERRIALAKDGTLLVTGADRFRFYDMKYDGADHEITEPDILRNFTGRVLRINRDGSLPVDNPWMNRPTVEGATWAHGLRDPQGAAVHPVTGELWVTDHGPQGGDEIDIIKPGKDYGWPNVAYGYQYDFQRTDGRKDVPIARGRHSAPGVEEPVYWWGKDIGPSGMMFYTGDVFPAWKGSLFVGGLASQSLVRLVLDGNRVVAEEHLLKDLKRRIRDVRQAPDGTVYVLAGDGLFRITPAKIP